ncbi:glycosyltransferase [Candidatus Sumerlaeota bacterium]|nr:glycosyltransferase [Candidatus Sumerlaeota bacterium]
MMNQGHSILFLLDNLELGGIQRQLLEVCTALIQQGNRCVVACFRSKPDSMVEKYRKAGVGIVFLEKRKGIDICFFFRLKKLFKRENFDLIHAMTPQASFWTACALPFKSNTRFVGSLLNTYKLDQFLERLCETLIAAPRMDAVFINSRAGALYYKSMIANPPPIWRIYNGVRIPAPVNREEIRNKLNIKPHTIALLCVGRLETVKRHVDALTALSIIRKQNPDISLHIIGDGSLRKHLESCAANLKVKDHVVFVGERDDTSDILSGFDIFLMPSRSEGFPNALLEAMAAGIPCIAAKAGGIPEIIRDKKNGILVNPCSPGELAEAINNLMVSPETRKELGETARQDMIKRFDIHRMIDNMISHYQSLLLPGRYKLAYVLSLFPKISEAFILREMAEMRKRGIPFCIVSLKSAREKAVHNEAKTLMDDTFYLPWINLNIILSNMFSFLDSPVSYLKTFWRFIRLHRSYPKETLKAFLVWFKTVGFARILKRNGVVHIHANWATMPASCALAMSEMIPCSFSFTAHAFDIYYIATSLEEKIRKAVFVATCTEKNRAHLCRLAQKEHERKIHLARHFIPDPEGIVISPETPPVALSIGSLDRYKGHDLLIQACRILWRKGLDFHLRIIGEGPEKMRLKYLIRRNWLEEKATLIGGMPQDQVFRELGKATIFALASVKGKRSDNLPNALIEASLLNVPCVMSDIGSVREFIIPEETGLLFKPGYIMDLSEKIERLLKDEELRKRLARNAKEKALEMFSVEKNAPIMENLLRDAIEIKSHKG